eukprot:GAHX01002043.1.p1 GENE.GAHX01002043.1~~GAHX01002043.1.p1  ORF type:complete len:584 (+),score=157.46 GAHX01002043.1:69-1820(+)
MDESSSDINSFIIDKDPTEEDIQAAKLIGFNAAKTHSKTSKTFQTTKKSKRNNILAQLEASPISGLEDISEDSDLTGESLDSSNPDNIGLSSHPLTKSNQIKPFTSNSTPFSEKNNSKSRTLYWSYLGKMTHSILQLEENIRIDFSDVDFSAPVSLTVSQHIVAGCFSEFGLIIVYQQKDKLSVAFRAFSGDRKLIVIKTDFEHSKVLSICMSKELILLTTASLQIKHLQTVFLFNIYGREIASFVSPKKLITASLTPNFISILSSHNKNNNNNNTLIERYKIINNKYIKKESLVHVPSFLKVPNFMSFDEFDNLYVSDKHGNLIMLHNYSSCVQFILNFKFYFNDELNEHLYFPIYIKNQRLFYVKQQKNKGKYITPFTNFNLNLIELNVLNYNRNSKQSKHSKVQKEEQRSTLFGNNGSGMTKLEKLESEFNNLNLFSVNKNKREKEVNEDKLIIRIVSELIRVRKNEGLIIDYVKLLNKKVSMQGAVKLCRNYNMFRMCEKIEEIMGERFKEEDNKEKMVSDIKEENEKESIKVNEEMKAQEEKIKIKIDENKMDIKEKEKEEKEIKKTKEVFVNPFKFK